MKTDPTGPFAVIIVNFQVQNNEKQSNVMKMTYQTNRSIFKAKTIKKWNNETGLLDYLQSL